MNEWNVDEAVLIQIKTRINAWIRKDEKPPKKYEVTQLSFKVARIDYLQVVQ